jgi:hypothetical protein
MAECISSNEIALRGNAVNWVHVHLILCHAPVLGCIIGLVLLLFALIRSSRELLVTALWILVLSAIIGIPTFTSGERAEHRVEHLAGVDRAAMEEHEDTANFAFILLEALGILSLAALTRIHRNRRVPRWIGSLTLIVAVATAIALGWTANLGGLIRHTEIHGVSSGLAPPTRSAPD